MSTAHIASVTCSPSEKAEYLLTTVGPRTAAAGLGLSDARPLKAWAGGGSGPRAQAVAERLDTLYQVVRTISEVYSPAVAVRLLRSANPELDDESPLAVLASDDRDSTSRVLAAVRSFLED